VNQNRDTCCVNDEPAIKQPRRDAASVVTEFSILFSKVVFS
jgi:hypothetical protein